MSNIGEFRKQRRNANKHTERGLKLLSESVDRDGWIGALTIAADGETFDGSARLVTAQQDTTLEPIVVDSDGTRPVIVRRTDIATADDPKAKRLGVMANHVTATDWEPDAAILAEIAKDDAVIAALTKEDARLAELLRGEAKQEPKDAGELIDKAAELQAKWQVQRGDVWTVGKHRVMCGDSTNAADVATLMQGERAQLLFTSPPYAAQREYTIGKFDWDALMDGVFMLVPSVMADDGAILVNLGLVHREKRVCRYWDKWLDRMDATEWPLFDWYVWDKLNGLMGDWRGRLAPAHEWIFHFSKNPRRANKTEQTKYAENGVTHYKINKVGLREKDGSLKGFTQAGQPVSQTKVLDSVIRCQPARGGVDGHPAPFSVELAKVLIEAFTTKDEAVYEPFGGSGSSIVACEQTGRIGRGMEIEPKYVAVTLERLAGLGLTSQRIGNSPK